MQKQLKTEQRKQKCGDANMKDKEIEERFKILEQRIVNLDAKFMGQIAVARDRHLLTNDRINELFDIYRMLERMITK